MNGIISYPNPKLRVDTPTFNFDLELGYLARYVPFKNAPYNDYFTKKYHKSKTYSPEILDFKLGSQRSIDYFVETFREFAEAVLDDLRIRSAVLIPVPSSVPVSDSDYTTEPQPFGSEKNRDNRGEIFLEKVCLESTKLIYCNGIERIIRKPKKTRMGVEEQAKTLRLKRGNDFEKKVIILFDDVVSSRQTFDACKLVIEKKFNPKRILCFALGKTTYIENFNIN